MTAATEVARRSPHALYRFYSATGALLYVGLTADPGTRWRQHRQVKPWWQEVATVTIQTYPGRAMVEEAERYAIRRERPRYNVAHHPDRRPVPLAADVGELVMSAEIAQMFGVTRQAVHLWYQQRARNGFPEPVTIVKAGAIWRTADVVRWAEARGREVRDG